MRTFLGLSLAAILLIEVFFALERSWAQVNNQPSRTRPELIIQSGETDSVRAMAFSPDGRILATGGQDSVTHPQVKLWDLATGVEIRTLEGSMDHDSVAFSPDGRVLASAGLMGAGVKVWSIESGKVLRTLAGESPVLFSPNGKVLAGAYGSGSVKLWDVATGAQLALLEGHPFQIRATAFSPDGRILATAGSGTTCGDVMVQLWDVATGRNVRSIRSQCDARKAIGETKSIAFSPDGKLLAGTTDYETVELWDPETGAGRTFKRYDSQPNAPRNSPDQITFTADGTLAIVVRGKDAIELWNTSSGTQIRSLKGGDPIAVSADGKVLASLARMESETERREEIHLWDLVSGAKVRTLGGRTPKFAESVAFSPDGRTLAKALLDGIEITDVTTGEVRALKNSRNEVYSAPGVLAFSPDGRFLVEGNGVHVATLWDLNTGRQWKIIKTSESSTLDQACDEQGIVSVSLSRDNKRLAASNDYRVEVFNTVTGAKLRTIQKKDCEDQIGVTLSPDGTILALSGEDNSVQFISVTTGKRLRTISKADVPAFSPDGKTVALVREHIEVLSVATGAQLARFDTHIKDLFSLKFSPDGRILAAVGEESVELWDVTTGKALSTVRFSDTSNPLTSEVEISRDNRLLIRPNAHGLTVWDVSSGQELATLVTMAEDEWLVVTPEGLFDGSPNGWKQIIWRFNNNTFDHAPVEAFFNEFYYPGLLSDIFADKRPRAPTDISQKDRRQSQLKLTTANAQKSAAHTARNVNVEVEVVEAASDKEHQSGGGAQDVRLFRNGSLVKVWRGDVLKGQSSVMLEATVPIVAGENKFVAYAFNHDNIKSSDAELVVTGAESLKRQGTAYILAIGVNGYANQNYNLKYAVADAEDFAAEVKRQQEALKRYAKVEVISLSDTQATKANITQKLLDVAKQVQPEDAVIVFFAGHGTAQGNQFYLIPHDLGYDGPRENLSKAGLQTILDNSISDRELERLFEGIDAGQLLLVIDACNSGQALDAEEKRRGPMNSKGLAQLAYEKGMYVLTAAQSYQAAQEAAKFGHGFLTYALVEEGLKQGAADREPKNGSIDIREWLNFATDEVPKMQQAHSADALRGRGRYVVFVGDGREVGIPETKADTKDNVQRPRVFYRRELESDPLVVAILGTTKPR